MSEINEVFIVFVGQDAIGAYSNEAAARKRYEAVRQHPALPNRGWARWQRFKVFDDYDEEAAMTARGGLDE
jgi:hypothetical protein